MTALCYQHTKLAFRYLVSKHWLNVDVWLPACVLAASCLNGGINSSKLADGFQFNEPTTRTRSASLASRQLKLPPMVVSRYVDNAPTRRCISNFNRYANLFDAETSTQAFKARVRGQFTVERREFLQRREQERNPGAMISSASTSRR